MEVGIEVTDVLGDMGESSQAAAPALQEALKDKSREIRHKAAEALSNIW